MNHRLDVMQIVERLNREEKVAVIMVSHDLNLASEFCARLILMDRGKVAADGAPVQVLNEDLLGRVYQCGVKVQQDQASGQVTVAPARRIVAPCSGSGMRVHVVAGGGSGEELMRRLNLCGFAVTCGVLNSGDSDAEVADALGVEQVLEKPFSPVSMEAMEKAGRMVDAAEAVIVCGVPFGPGNLVNLDLAKKALDSGKKVLLMTGIESRDYTPGKQAAAMFRDLVDDGAVMWSSTTELLIELQ
jgi:iron complex transport system ATP-binding protein